MSALVCLYQLLSAVSFAIAADFLHNLCFFEFSSPPYIQVFNIIQVTLFFSCFCSFLTQVIFAVDEHLSLSLSNM
jgi:hypothetical protein